MLHCSAGCSQSSKAYFIALSLQLNVNVTHPMPHGYPRGLDLGFDKFVATSDGEEIKRPRFLRTLQRQLKLLQRRLRNKLSGSNNRHKLNQKISRLHQQKIQFARVGIPRGCLLRFPQEFISPAQYSDVRNLLVGGCQETSLG